MNYSYKLNQNTNFPGQSSEKKKKPVYDSYPYRAQLNYDSAPSLLGRIPSSDDSPSLFAPQSEGERIRRQLKSAVDKALGKPSYSGIFDNIDTKKIEENIPVAESVIRKNKENNAYSMEDTKNLPYLRDGLAAFYALSEAGNHKAANVARKIAYTPYTNAEKKTKDTKTDFSNSYFKASEKPATLTRDKYEPKKEISKQAIDYQPFDSYNADFTKISDSYFEFGKENQPSVVPKDSLFDDDYTEYLAKKEIQPEGILKRYVLTGTAQKSDTKSQSSENQIISTSEAATLAKNVYVLSKHNGSKPEDVGDWKYLYSHSNSESLQIAVYKKVKNGKTYYALVNAGTEGEEVPKEFVSDWTNNLQQSFGMSDDMKDSIEFAQKFVAGRPDTEIIFIGHSKGGAEAAANAVATNCNAIIFNPARANYEAYGLDRDGYSGNITAFVVEGEPLDVGLDALSSFLWFIPQQEANTYELKKEKKSNSHSKNPFKELKRNIDELKNLHSMDYIIDILKE